MAMPSFAAEARSITGVERISSSGEMSLKVTFEAGEPGDNHALYIAYDTEDKGADISNWAELQRGCIVAADAMSATIPVSPLLTGKGYTVCRVFLTTSAAPYDTQIEYLRQTGSQYIDTGIRPDATSVAVMDTKFDSNNPRQQRFFGISSGDDATAVFSFDCYINGNGKFASACKDGKGAWKEAAAFTANRVRISLSAKDKHRIVITNLETGSQIVDATRKTTCSKTSIANLLVFALHTVKNSVASIPTDMIAQGARLYSFSVTTNSVIACDYKPCKLGDRVGVYDAVTDTVIYSASGTDFDAANSGSPVACSLLADYWAQWAVTGCGRFVTTAASGTNRGWTIEEGATFSLHPDFDTSSETSGQNYVVSSNATLEVGASGTLYVNGNTLTLADRASLSFNFTERATSPVFALGSKYTPTLTVGGAVAVKLSGVRPRAGEHVLTACGGFDAEGVTVSLASGAPNWVKSVSVNEDGNIVLDVKPMGTRVIVR